MKEREPLFSTKNLNLLRDPLNDSNPITVQVLGICSALAVTVKLKPSVVMAISVMAVLAVSNVVISLLRKSIPPRIRIIVQLVVIATMVILVDEILQAFPAGKVPPIEKTTMRTEKEMEPYMKEPFSEGWRPVYALRKMGL